MKEELSITTERIDDFVVLLKLMHQMDLPSILDRHLPRHWLQQGLSWGWTATIWLAHIVSQGDHRKLTVRDWRSEEHTSELQSPDHLVCRLLLEKKKNKSH